MNFRIKILDLVRKTNQNNLYNSFIENQFKKTEDSIIAYQNNAKEKILQHHIKHNKNYREWLISKGIDLTKKIEFDEIPIINKKDLLVIHPFIEKFIHQIYHTGGTTGTPFKYSLSRESVSSLWPNLWRAFNTCGIKPCTPIIMIAGPSLYNNRSIPRKIFDWINRFTVISAFDLNTDKLQNTYDIIKQKNIKGIYGYTSAILIFLRHLEKNNLYLDLRGIFSTSETFIPKIRTLAKTYCNCDVFDIYGANDGGICAFECQEHNGYHISYERTYVEIIAHKIILTDLTNLSFPFIRYEVGDVSNSNEIIYEKCKCGSSLPKISSISGRVNSYITDSNGNRIHTEFFSHLFNKDETIIQFQVSEKFNIINVNIISDKEDIKYYQTKYNDAFNKRFIKKIGISVNSRIYKNGNEKTPIFIKLD
ncbi:phenylacetate-CoA ligase [Mariniphaga anaerophila]|uniref:Phenylacetate-CoA ligase n=1 Tax=Mariniphaga anaerophila TaxID=1484053 RepID=A0A1M4VKY8_9BACT|nr:phenylacetate--CoA ligase family protein [Mariniphaga anaerophila]SHE69492.1 phenylacetate-CoA ligase [Mariniphaga anaerophila]